MTGPHGGLRLRYTAPEKLVGALIGRHRVVNVLGTGGMGAVLAARSLDDGAEVALKVLRPEAVTPSNLSRFRREAKVLTALHHPNICRVFGHGMLDTGAPYIIMELLHGETLLQRLHTGGALKVGDAVALTLELLDALAAAHASGVVHRDLKPSNIFLTQPPNAPSPTAKLIDFGLARLLPATKRSKSSPDVREGSVSLITITGTDEIAGTPSYLCPEQLGGVKDLDERVDVWGMGVVFYEMLAGQKAFTAESGVALRARIAYDEPLPLRVFREDVPEGICAVIAGALVKSRSGRYRSARAFRDALTEAWVAHRAAAIARGQTLAPPRMPMTTEVIDEEDTLVEPASTLGTNPRRRDATTRKGPKLRKK